MRELYRALLVCVPLAGACGLTLVACIQLYRWRILRRAARQATTEPVHTVRPDHGADEKFGRELHALRDMEPSPELVSDIETELRWGLIWHDFETHLRAEVDRIFAPALVWADCESFDEVRELAGITEDEGLVLA